MSRRPDPRARRIPQRTCVGCRMVLPKRSLIRVVRAADGVRIDPGGKLAGRGAYVHDRRDCWERALKGALVHALKTVLTTEDRERLEAFARGLPEEPAGLEAIE